jgi:hypothetical protein
VENILSNGAFVFWGAIVLICVVPTIVHYWWKIRQAELDAALKQDMLNRGMSAEEIQMVLRTSSGDSKTKKCIEQSASDGKS